MSWLRQTDEGAVLRLHIVPRASKDEIRGLHGEALKIRLQAPPVEGKANKALLRFLARRLGVPASRLALLSGASGRDKQVLVAGMSTETVERMLSG